MTRTVFVAELKRIGLDPSDHDVDALHAAYTRLTGLFHYLDTDADREAAKTLPRFDPREPL